MLTKQEYSRYSRHLLLDTFDEQAQEVLKQATVMVFGVGGLGNQVTMALASAGVGKLVLIDDDHVDISNLPRQWLFGSEEVGKTKVDAAAQRLHALNPHCNVLTVPLVNDEAAISKHLQTSDILVDCTDNQTARFFINRLAYTHHIPLISAAASGFIASVVALQPWLKTGCYQCLEDGVNDVQTCIDQGIYSPVVAMAGQLQAMLTLNFLTGVIPIDWGQLSRFDATGFRLQHYTLAPDPACPVCGD